MSLYWTIQGKVRSRRRADTRPRPTDQCAKSPYKKEPEITILLNNRRRSFCELLGFSQTWWLPHFYVVETGRSGARTRALQFHYTIKDHYFMLYKLGHCLCINISYRGRRKEGDTGDIWRTQTRYTLQIQ